MVTPDETSVTLNASPGGVAVIELNRPEKHNAFNNAVIARLDDVLETLRAADDLRCVILRAKGKSFSAGADLDWMRSAAHYDEHENFDDALALATMLDKLYRLPQLTIAAVNGACMGGGCGLVAACDVAVAVSTAMFRFSEVRLGLTPATISPFVIEAIGPKWARALFTTGEAFDAAYAEKIGLVQFVVEDAAAMEAEIARISEEAFHTAPDAVAAAKALVRDVTHRPINADLAKLTARRIAERRGSDEGKEGLTAFLEKRKPSWAD